MSVEISFITFLYTRLLILKLLKVCHGTLAKQVKSRSLSGIPWKVTDFKFSVTLRHSLIVLHNCDRNMHLLIISINNQ